MADDGHVTDGDGHVAGLESLIHFTFPIRHSKQIRGSIYKILKNHPTMIDSSEIKKAKIFCY